MLGSCLRVENSAYRHLSESSPLPMPTSYHELCKAGPDGRTPLTGSERLLRALVIKCGLEREHLQTAALLIFALEESIREQRRSTSMEPQGL
jgi:hypothetical protein